MPKKKTATAFQEIISQVKQPVAKAAKPAPKQAAKETTAPRPAASTSLPTSGKSSDPAYTQANVYIRKTTKRDVQVALLMKFPELDMSDLAELLFSDWLKKNN